MGGGGEEGCKYSFRIWHYCLVCFLYFLLAFFYSSYFEPRRTVPGGRGRGMLRSVFVAVPLFFPSFVCFPWAITILCRVRGSRLIF